VNWIRGEIFGKQVDLGPSSSEDEVGLNKIDNSKDLLIDMSLELFLLVLTESLKGLLIISWFGTQKLSC